MIPLNTKYAIVCSSKDTASINIKDSLVSNHNFSESDEYFEGNKVLEKENIKIYTIERESIYAENIDQHIKADFFIFASKHQSKSKIPSLTVHSIGNWGKAELGGKDNTLVRSSALLQRDLFLNLNKYSTSKFEIVNEATHHGPYLDEPTMFIEIGSTKLEWSNKDNADIIAKVIINTLKKERGNSKVSIGIGGLHTCTNFNNIVLNENIAIAHFCPKYALLHLNKKMIIEAINKTIEKVDFILIDYKGLKTEKQRILRELDELKIEYKRTSEF